MEGKNKMMEEVRRKKHACAHHRAKSVRRTEVSASDWGRHDLNSSPLECWWCWWWGGGQGF